MASKYAKEFLVTTKITENGIDHSYPLGPLEGKAPGPYAAIRPIPRHPIPRRPNLRRPNLIQPRVAPIIAPPVPVDPLLDPTTAALIQWAQGHPKASAKAVELAGMALQRPISYAEGKSATGLLGTDRAYHKEGGLAFIVGEVKSGEEACEKCQGKGKAPFSECVVVRGFSGGSCANCHYFSHGGRCSLRPQRPRQ